MKKPPFVSETGASEQGDYTTQQELFPVVFNPKWPRPHTMPAEALRRMLEGERLTQPSFGFQGWRLAAYIKSLEYLGWVIRRTDVTAPDGFKTQKPIRLYWLPTEVISQALNLRGQTK